MFTWERGGGGVVCSSCCVNSILQPFTDCRISRSEVRLVQFSVQQLSLLVSGKFFGGNENNSFAKGSTSAKLFMLFSSGMDFSITGAVMLTSC